MQKDNLGLKLPEQTKTTPSVDLSLNAIEKWRANLQTTDLTETTKSILKHLESINTTVLHPTNRFEIIECIRPLSQVIYQSFKQRYVNQTEPLSKQKISFLELSKNLQIEMLNCYKIIIVDIYNSFKNELKNSTLPNAIYRAFKHYSNLLTIYYQTYTQYPENVWIEMHILYKLALDCKITTNSINLDINEQKNKLFTSTPYKQTLFIASIDPFQWAIKEQEILLANTPAWEEYIVIREFKSNDIKGNDLYYISLSQDLAPFAVNNKIELVEPGLILDLSKLTGFLNSNVTPPKKSSLSESQQKDSTFIYYTLQKLINYLISGHSRKLERFNISGEVSVAFGLPSTHFYINKRREFKPESVGTEQDIIGQDLQLTLDLEESDGGQKDFKPDQALYQCKLINIHPQGARIAFQNSQFPPIQPGELVAMAINIKNLTDLNETYWNVGILRWLKHNKELELHSGIEIIAPFAMAAAIQLTKDNKSLSYFQRAFLFNSNSESKKFNIITPAAQFETGKKVKIYSFHHNKSIETSLKEQLLISNNFKLFDIDINF